MQCELTQCEGSIQTLPRFKEDPGVFQVGDSGGLHHDSPAALSQSEAVHREHRGSGSGGQGAGPGESAVTEPHRQHDNTTTQQHRKYPRTSDLNTHVEINLYRADIVLFGSF